MKPFIKTSEMVVKKLYRVLAIKELDTQYGHKMTVELNEFIYILPDSYTKNSLAVLLHPDIVKTNPVFITLLEPNVNQLDVPNLTFICHQ